jgi:ketosteroid isomerase-like protein
MLSSWSNHMPTNDEQDVLAISHAWQRAIVANDTESIRRFTTDDWVLVDHTGLGTRTQFLDLVASNELTHSAMQSVEGSERVRIYENTAIVTSRVTNTAHYHGQTFFADEWTTDIYQRTDSGWKCVLSQITPVQQT